MLPLYQTRYIRRVISDALYQTRYIRRGQDARTTNLNIWDAPEGRRLQGSPDEKISPSRMKIPIPSQFINSLMENIKSLNLEIMSKLFLQFFLLLI